MWRRSIGPALFVALIATFRVAADLGKADQQDGASAILVGEQLLTSGSIRRVPENGVVDSVGSGSEISCAFSDDDGLLFKWFRLGKRSEGDEVDEDDGIQQDGEEELNVTGKTVTLDTLGLAGQGVVRIRCRLDPDSFADFRVNFGNDSDRRAFRVKNFPASYSVVNLDDLKVFCEVNNRTNVPLEDVRRQVGLRWYKWSVPNDESFAAGTAKDDQAGAAAAGSANCTRESMEGSLWVEIEGAEIVPGEPEPHIQLLARDDMPDAVIKIEDATEDDRRGYKCVAYNLTRPEECDSSVFFVRVKDKYAALWPFLGIVAEVVALCLIIFICERRRSAKLPDEEDEEEPYSGNGQSTAPGSGANASDSSNVRQRRS